MPAEPDRKHALWLMPGGEERERLLALITGLSESYGTPLFEPHITLLGGLVSPEGELVPGTEELASSAEPFAVELDGIGHMEEYYRCLFAKVRETEELMGLNRMAREVFGRAGDPPFMPHVSLLYSNMRASRKKRLIHRVEHELGGLRFRTERLYLYLTEGEPPDWREAASFPFSAG
jgi:2'-5' RNA ligase